MRNSRGSAFSLIEMLVVVGVILLLAGMLYPALVKAKEWGRAAKCGANLRQLYLATIIYATDEGRKNIYTDAGTYPDSGDWWRKRAQFNSVTYPLMPGWVGRWGTVAANTYPATAYAWRGTNAVTCLRRGSLWAYVNSNQTCYLCPTFAQRSVCGFDDAVRSYSMCTGTLSITTNQPTAPVGLGKKYSDTSIIAPQTIMYADDGNVTNSLDAQMATNEVGRWHNGKGQAVFADGHVERL